MTGPPPTLYTFRRCPYAMRARWAIASAGVMVEQVEVSLRNKPTAMLTASPKGTVPVLLLPDGGVIDQSLDIMLWALRQHDPEQWLTPDGGTLPNMLGLIDACERGFKPHLDRYKYPQRYQNEWAAAEPTPAEPQKPEQHFSDTHFFAAQRFLDFLEQRLEMTGALSGRRPGLADFAIVPFVRQMARHEPTRFAAAVPPALMTWMDALLARADFQCVMQKPT